MSNTNVLPFENNKSLDMKNKLNILLIEDDMIEIMKLNRTISSLKLNHLPDIILLDLNMPKINGIEFLSILKNDEVLKYIPTIILTTSNNQKDLLECYKIGIAGYVIKPLKYEDYVSKIERVLNYWSVNELIVV